MGISSGPTCNPMSVLSAVQWVRTDVLGEQSKDKRVQIITNLPNAMSVLSAQQNQQC